MSCSRRDFIKYTLKGTAATVLPLAGLRWLTPTAARAAVGGADIRWVFLVDTRRCVGCGFCVRACKLENKVPYEAPVTRTWVERYVVTRDGKAHMDSPDAARDGFLSSVVGGEKIDPNDISKAFFVPKLCNQCDNPPCVQVCPVGATYQTGEGVVLVDGKWCIGCGYCIMACPYGVRFFHPVHKVVEKCTFCYHRVMAGKQAACVQACSFGARRMGNLRDQEDPVTKLILSERVAVLKDEYGTKPRVFYIGLDANVR